MDILDLSARLKLAVKFANPRVEKTTRSSELLHSPRIASAEGEHLGTIERPDASPVSHSDRRLASYLGWNVR
jgi:hypothetical protein